MARLDERRRSLRLSARGYTRAGPRVTTSLCSGTWDAEQVAIDPQDLPIELILKEARGLFDAFLAPIPPCLRQSISLGTLRFYRDSRQSPEGYVVVLGHDLILR